MENYFLTSHLFALYCLPVTSRNGERSHIFSNEVPVKLFWFLSDASLIVFIIDLVILEFWS